MADQKRVSTELPVSGTVLALRRDIASGMRPIARFDLGKRTVDVMLGSDAVWAIIRRPGLGGVALRLAHCPGAGASVRKRRKRAGECQHLEITSAIGRHDIVLRTDTLDLGVLRATVELTPSVSLLVPFHPRDVYRSVRMTIRLRRRVGSRRRSAA